MHGCSSSDGSTTGESGATGLEPGTSGVERRPRDGSSVATDAGFGSTDVETGLHCGETDGAHGRRYWGVALASLGVTFAAAGLTFWFAWGFPGTTATNQAVLGIVVHVLFGYAVVMSGITIYRSELAVEECLVAVQWCLGGFLLMSGLVVWEAASELLAGEVTLAFLNRLIVIGSVGAAAGVLVGLNRGQAVQNERLVDEGAERRETLVFLLRLLRHDLQNDLTAVAGHVDRL